jgi:hypothetical protein
MTRPRRKIREDESPHRVPYLVKHDVKHDTAAVEVAQIPSTTSSTDDPPNQAKLEVLDVAYTVVLRNS